jgi:mitochondrial fission protein ELM1
MRKIKVLCLSDGKPGHYNQTKGFLYSLSGAYELEVVWVDIRLRFKFFGFFYRYLINNHLDSLPFSFFRFIYKVSGSYDFSPDLVVATGGDTRYFLAAIKNKTSALLVFIGGLRGIDSLIIDINLVIEFDGGRNQVQIDLAPTDVDLLPVAADDKYWMLAIGGDSGVYEYTDQDWSFIVKFMKKVQDDFGVVWFLTTSRRTGVHVDQYLKKALCEEGVFLKDYVFYSEEARPVMKDYFELSSVVFCTEDSFTMLTEAVSSGRKVVSLVPGLVRESDFYERSINRLVQKGLLARVEIEDVCSLMVLDILSGLSCLKEPVSKQVLEKVAPIIEGKFSG